MSLRSFEDLYTQQFQTVFRFLCSLTKDMMTQDLVFGDDAAKIEKATMLFTANEDFILSTHAMGQSGEIGPFTAGTEVELIGLAVNEETGLNRPLSFEQATWHLKTGDETGFLGYRDDSVLTQVSP